MIFKRKLSKKSDKTEVKLHSRRHKIISAIFWIIGWPLLVSVLALIVFGILAVSLSGLLSGGDNANGYQLRGFMALFAALMVLVCFGLVWAKKREHTDLSGVSARILHVYIWLGIVLGALIIVAIPDPQTSAANAGINVKQTNAIFTPNLTTDPAITATLKTVGATDIDGIETKFITNFGKKSVLDDQLGQYQAYVDQTTKKWSYGKLLVKKDLHGNQLNVVVAHEYLHHVWFKDLSEKTKIRLTSDLITMYGRDPLMQGRATEYSDKQMLQPTELFSYYCTESSNGYLTKYVLGQCNKYINRGSLVMTR